MRAEYLLAMRRDSAELEQELIEQRVEAAYERCYEYLEPAATYLRSVLDEDGLRALKQMENAFHAALEETARSGLGCIAGRRIDRLAAPRRSIAALPAPLAEAAPPAAQPDQVIHVGFRG
jgi:hypothetical protein